MNPIFSKNPEKALALARALGAVQGPRDGEGKRLQVFLALSRPMAVDVLDVFRTSTAVIGVRMAVRYRVGPISLALYVDVTRMRPGGITAVAEEDVQALYTSIPEAALYVPPHNHGARGNRKCRCRRLRAATRALMALNWAGQRGMPDSGFQARPHGWYGAFTYGAVDYAVKQHCPRLVESASQLAREVAWRTAKEKEKEAEK